MAIQDNQYTVSKLVCFEDMPLAKIVTSETLRQSLESKTGHKLPNSGQTLKNMVVDFSIKAKNYVNGKLIDDRTMKSITIDEWTSISNKRYLNVNIHSLSGNFSLGLVHIDDKANSENLFELLKGRLSEFSVDWKQIISITCDGASVMVKLGRISNKTLQLCFAHGLHLGNNK